MKSFIITGASASGKSTLVDVAICHGYEYLPTHMTRQRRIGEVAYRDAVFLSNQEFELNFANGMYFEPTLEYAQSKVSDDKIYYGTPKDWANTLKDENKCATPVSPVMARKVLEIASNPLWLHLICDEEDRRNRLKERGLPEKEIEDRMTRGESLIEPPEAIILNTSLLTPVQILDKVNDIGSTHV
jgi:guanylate kinase